MNSFGVFSYATAASAFLLLFMLLMTSWRGHLQGTLFTAAIGASLLWAAAHTYQFTKNTNFEPPLLFLELLRDLFWLWFLMYLLRNHLKIFNRITLTIISAWTALIIYWLGKSWETRTNFISVDDLAFAFLGISLLVLIAVEQLYRNTRKEQRSAIKSFCLALAGLFIFDAYFYGQVLLQQKLDLSIWQARGFANALSAPLFIVAAMRNSAWSFDISISRHLAFHSSMLLITGIYFCFIGFASTSFHINETWGEIFQVLLLFISAFGLMAILMSEKFHAHIRVFINKNFYNYKYDYRDEWLHLTSALAEHYGKDSLKRQSIIALAEMIESQGGMLWQRNEQGAYRQTENWNSVCIEHEFTEKSSLIAFLQARRWVIDLYEYAATPEHYGDLDLPSDLQTQRDLWLIVPLFLGEQLTGFIILARSRVSQELNWEDNDILKTAARQIAGDLAQYDAMQMLAEARQFEAYSRISAFVMHDLKNILGQLSLVSENAKRHQDKPAFIQDVFYTIEAASARMQRLLQQLKPKSSHENLSKINLKNLLNTVVSERRLVRPQPAFLADHEDLHVYADLDRLTSVITNLVQNAQEATDEHGQVLLRLQLVSDFACIEIKDNGRGMSGEFVRKQLFRPFTSTKGEMGMGIGACEAREYIHKLGGRLTVESELGKGTLFKIWLPLTRDSINKVA